MWTHSRNPKGRTCENRTDNRQWVPSIESHHGAYRIPPAIVSSDTTCTQRLRQLFSSTRRTCSLNIWPINADSLPLSIYLVLVDPNVRIASLLHTSNLRLRAAADVLEQLLTH